MSYLDALKSRDDGFALFAILHAMDNRHREAREIPGVTKGDFRFPPAAVLPWPGGSGGFNYKRQTLDDGGVAALKPSDVLIHGDDTEVRLHGHGFCQTLQTGQPEALAVGRPVPPALRTCTAKATTRTA